MQALAYLSGRCPAPKVHAMASPARTSRVPPAAASSHAVAPSRKPAFLSGAPPKGTAQRSAGHAAYVHKQVPRPMRCSAAQLAELVSEEGLKKLQNGSDIRGVAMEGVEGEPVTISPENMQLIGSAFAAWLKTESRAKEEFKVAIGHDSRLTAEWMVGSITSGLTAAGVHVYHTGLSSTPAMFTSTFADAPGLDCPMDAGIMVTASHLPFNRNGLKMFTAEGSLNKSQIAEVLALAAAGGAPEAPTPGAVKAIDFMNRVYAPGLVAKVRAAAPGNARPLEGMKIVVDAGNGAGGFFASQVLEQLGADTTGSVFLDPDGNFPNHIPNPEEAAAIAAIQKAVRDSGADLGVIFDTDVDRSGLVTGDGLEVNKNRLIALLSAVVLEEHPGTTIVTDSVTSDGLAAFIAAAGGRHLRFKRGYKNVIDKAVELNKAGTDAQLAIETSGHGAFKENRWLDDGAYSVTKILMRLAAAPAEERRGEIARLLASLEEAEYGHEMRFKILEKNFGAYGQGVLEALEAYAKDKGWQVAEPSFEGVRVAGEGGWVLLRLSLHDPVMPLNVEAPSEAAAKKLLAGFKEALGGFEGLDITPLEEFLA